MVTELAPKLTDIKTLREISRIIITPMLIVAVMNQTGFQILGIAINESSQTFVQLLQFLGIFIVTSTVVGLVAWAIHDLMIYLQFFTNFKGITILSTLCITFGLMGVIGDNPSIIKSIDAMWFYSSFVCGFYLLARADEIEKYFS